MISVKIRTTPTDLAKRISDAPLGARTKMVDAAAWYLVGETSNNYRGLKHYPAPRPNQKYKRTFKLREGWGFVNYGAKIRVTNSVSYAQYVQGDNTQAWMHVGRWRTISKVAADNVKGMIRAAEAALQSYLKSKGLSK